MKNQKNTIEGPKDFSRFLAMVADGVAHQELSSELQRVVGLIREEAEARDEPITGGIKLTLSITIDPKGHADVSYDIAVKEPKKKRPETLFFVTRGDNLTDEMTKQPGLPVRDVSAAPRANTTDSASGAGREI